MLNRDGLTILLRPESGNDLRDHGVHAACFWALLPLRLEAFQQQGETV
jgi:aromatic ring-cleaving dioxygenase